MRILSTSALSVLCMLFICCNSNKQSSTDTTNSGMNTPWYETASETELLDSVQLQTFRYFWEYAEPNSGLARERFIPSGVYPMDDAHIVTTGGTGFGIMAILAAIERGFITRAEGMERLQKITNFLEKADRFHGVWPHWLDGETGKTKPFSKNDDGGDLVESAFLIQGLLCVRQYCNENNPGEQALAEQINTLWEEMEWDWYTQGKNEALYWHWSPNFGWEKDFALRGYDETLITYILGASSPTHAISANPYHIGWARNGDIVAKEKALGYERVLDHYSSNDSPYGPLFWAHYSYLGLNPNGLKDKYADYWKLNTNHTMAHYDYAIENPKNFKGYGKNLWGMTSSYTRNKEGNVGYTSHRPDQDNGVISPTAAISSIPYAPEQSLDAIRGFYSYGDTLLGPAGFYDAFSPHYDWVVPRYLAIDQGPIIVMIENYRSGLIWDLFMSCPEIKTGLTTLGFTSDKLPA